MNEKEKIISVIWHELGHVFICVCEGASIKTLEFSKRGNYDNSGIRENTFGGLTCFEDEISISLKIQDLLLKEISFKFLNEIQKMKIDFKNHIKEN